MEECWCVSLCVLYVGDVYEMVVEDFFSYNKIPRILFKHKCRYSHVCVCVCV